jgi:Uma2 family endonuclease
MATAALVSVEEYLATPYKPACDYVDGVLYQKSMPTRKHGSIQIGLGQFINIGFPSFNASSEVNVRIRTGKYLVPDLIVQDRSHMQDPYPSEPVHLCVEILSPEDRLSLVIAKCEDYHDWGVETVWIVDPEYPRAWEFRKGQWLVEVPLTGSLTAPGISISLAELFSVL